MPTPCPCEGRADLPASRDRGDRRDTELHGRGPRGVLRGRQDPGRGYSQYRDHRSGRQGDLGRHTCAGYGSALAADRRDAGQAHPRILRRRSRAWCARTARSDSPATRFSASAAASCKAQQANVLYASSSTNSSSARNDSRNAIAPPRSDRTLGVVQGPFHRYASTYRPGATRTSRREGPEALALSAVLIEDAATGSPSAASTAAWMSLARIGSSRSARTHTMAFSTQPGRRGRCRQVVGWRGGPPLPRTAASFLARRASDPWRSWLE